MELRTQRAIRKRQKEDMDILLEWLQTAPTLMCDNCGRSFRPQARKDGSLPIYCRNRECQGVGKRRMLQGYSPTLDTKKRELEELISEQEQEMKTSKSVFISGRSIGGGMGKSVYSLNRIDDFGTNLMDYIDGENC